MVSQVFDPRHWNGHWKLVSRENYEELLRFNGVPEESFQGAKTADDFWTYEFSEDGISFHMLHEIPATNFKVNFKANIDGQWYSPCPYIVTTASKWNANAHQLEEKMKMGSWRNKWDSKYGESQSSSLCTEVCRNDGHVLRFWRTLELPNKILATIFVFKILDKMAIDGCNEEKVVGPVYCTFERTDPDCRPPPVTNKNKI